MNTCDKCGEPIVRASASVGTGYATNDKNEMICYDCCAINDREHMRSTGRIMLYDTDTELTNWPGTLRFPSTYRRKGHHNIAGNRYDMWFHFDGFEWHGVRYGDNTQIVHCRRTKTKSG